MRCIKIPLLQTSRCHHLPNGMNALWLLRLQLLSAKESRHYLTTLICCATNLYLVRWMA